MKATGLKTSLFIAAGTTLLMLAESSLSAEPDYLPTPPSLNSQTFLQNIDYPVSYYTGTANIVIPICSIDLKDISHTVNLSYSTSGIKVEQEASTVGLGWILNAGGVITKTIVGENDLHEYYSYFKSGCSGSPHLDCNDHDDIRNIYSPDTDYVLSDYITEGIDFVSGGTFEARYNALIHSIYSPEVGGKDFAPDIFNYSFFGNTGKFIFDKSKNIIKEREDDIILTPTFNDEGNEIEKWTAIVTDGTIFTFDKAEQVEYRPYMACNDSWLLTRVETARGSVIEFSYSTESRQYWIFNRYQETGNDGLSPQSFSLKNQMYDNCVYLDEIRFPGGRLTFSYLFDRQDAKWMPRLSSIQKYDGTGKKIQMWEMLQSYFLSSGSGTEIPTVKDIQKLVGGEDYDDNWNTKRLKLDGMASVDPDTGERHEYSLKYNENDLPTKLSSSIDHWGYFNGQPNRTIIGSVTHDVAEGNGTAEIESYTGADRDAYDTYNQAFILNRITYPTGGFTTFSYETNEYDTSDMEGDPYKKNFYYKSEETTLTEGAGYHNVPGSVVNSKKLDVPYMTGGISKVTVRYSVKINVHDYKTYYSPDFSFTLSLVKTAGENVVWSRVIKVPELPTASEMDESKSLFEGVSTVSAPGGEYELRITGSLREVIDETVLSANVNIGPEQYMQEHRTSKGGGLRIKEIVSHTDSATLAERQVFDYSSSGKLISFPRYNIGYNTYSSIGLRNTGYSVGYSKVTVSRKDDSGNTDGYTEYEFINKPDNNLHYSWTSTESKGGWVTGKSTDENPVGIMPYSFSENGTLLKETLYNSIRSRVKCTEYEYDLYGGLGHIYWGIIKNFRNFTESDANSYYTQETLDKMKKILIANGYEKGVPMAYLYPAIIPMEIRPVKKTETLFSSTGDNTVTTTYKYHEKYRNFVTEETVTDGNGDTRTTEFRYPFDYTTSVMETLVKDNMVSHPVSIRKYRNGREIMEQTKDYAFYSGNKKVRMSSEKYRTEDGEDSRTTAEYHVYDSYGNPQHITTYDLNTVYLWGYGGQYPVMEARNATFEQIKAALGQDADSFISSLSGKAKPDENDFERLDNLREALPDAMITIYRYAPGYGPSSVTDPRGVERIYEYDNMGRLSRTLERTGENDRKVIISVNAYDIL